MSTENQAAACIQARFRGFRWRRQQRRGIRAVTKLQALQRGRFTRREFAELRDFSREQESFQQATRRRQIRIWRNEQELYFLQHTNAADLEKVRSFQQQHSARLIQRAWRATNQSTRTSNDGNTVIVDPKERIYTFDPFGFETADAKAPGVRFGQWKHDEKSTDSSQRSLSLLLSEDELRASVSTHTDPSADDEVFVSRRKAIQERIKRKAAQEKTKLESTQKRNRCGATEGAKPTVNRRRELYEQVIAMKIATAHRVRRHECGARASRPERNIFSAQLIASCENRLKYLTSESPEQMTALEEDNQQVLSEVERWDPARRIQAWNHHRRAVCSVLDKQHWWQTQLAGDERDIRRIVVAKSPWEDENNIWVWPRDGHDNQKEAAADRLSSTSLWPSEEIQRFLVRDNGAKHQPIKPVSDDEASEWWRAHCTQSHLVTNGALFIEGPYRAEFSNNVTNEGDVFPVCTSEVVSNRDLYQLQQRAKRVARTKSLEQDIEQRIKALTAQVERHVHDMEAQVEANTQLAREVVQRKEQQRARITREQHASMTIQRYTRGMQGRKFARELRAEFFVMVRGRAIRRGRCEECGEQRAVLECQQCEESLHFCPICWVHVHSTRRRKTHVAIPMAIVVAPVSMQETNASKAPALTKPTMDVSNVKTIRAEENTGPRLRSLPSPPKESMTRSAQPAPANSSHSNDKEDASQSVTPIDVPMETTPELAEACALARRVRAEIGEAPTATTDVETAANNEKASDKGTRAVGEAESASCIEPPEPNQQHQIAAISPQASDTGTRAVDEAESASRIEPPEPNQQDEIPAISQQASNTNPVASGDVSIHTSGWSTEEVPPQDT